MRCCSLRPPQTPPRHPCSRQHNDRQLTAVQTCCWLTSGSRWTVSGTRRPSWRCAVPLRAPRLRTFSTLCSPAPPLGVCGGCGWRVDRRERQSAPSAAGGAAGADLLPPPVDSSRTKCRLSTRVALATRDRCALTAAAAAAASADPDPAGGGVDHPAGPVCARQPGIRPAHLHRRQRHTDLHRPGGGEVGPIACV